MTKPLAGPDQGEPKTSQLQQFPTVSSWSTLSLKRSALFSLAAAFSEPVDHWVARLCQVTNSSGLGSKQMGPTTGRWSVSKFYEWNEQTILHLPNPPASGSTSLLQCHLTPAEAGSCQELNWGLLPTATQDDQTVNSSLASSICVTHHHHCHHQNHNCNFLSFSFFLFLCLVSVWRHLPRPHQAAETSASAAYWGRLAKIGCGRNTFGATRGWGRCGIATKQCSWQWMPSACLAVGCKRLGPCSGNVEIGT